MTVNDLYSIDPFVDTIGHHFKQHKEGPGWDNSFSAHMWRTRIWPDAPAKAVF